MLTNHYIYHGLVIHENSNLDILVDNIYCHSVITVVPTI